MKPTLDEMSVFEQSRWFALMEAVEIIASECEERNINFNKLKISPLSVEKYIEKTSDIFAQKIERENAKKNNLERDLFEAVAKSEQKSSLV